jgi:GNAT superfamily N-acetyltransferase
VHIDPATPNDLSAIRDAYAYGREVQRAASTFEWPEFSDEAILAEIRAGRLFRVTSNGTIVGIFSLLHEDAAIWGEHERGAHLYLHRIVRGAAYPGRGLVDLILEWANAECRRLGREGLRMDTWAGNAALIQFYERRGFRLVEEVRLEPDPRLAPHYHGHSFALLERACG